MNHPFNTTTPSVRQSLVDEAQSIADRGAGAPAPVAHVLDITYPGKRNTLRLRDIPDAAFDVSADKSFPMSRAVRCFTKVGEKGGMRLIEIGLDHERQVFTCMGMESETATGILTALALTGLMKLSCARQNWSHIWFTFGDGGLWILGKDLRIAYKIRSGGVLVSTARVDV